MKSLSCVRLLETPWTAAHQAPPSVGFTRPVGLLMTAALRKGPGEGIAEMDSKHNRLKEPTVTGEFPEILYEKKKKKGTGDDVQHP